MALDILKEKGQPLDRQVFTWREMAGGPPISKLDDDAFTRVRVILMNGIESDALRFQHIASRCSRDLRLPLARLRRIEQHQQTLVNWLLPADQSPLETSVGYEQMAIEVTASIAQNEPDPYLAQVYRFGMLEDFDHLYRYAALLDRLEGKDANNILQSYTDVLPGRPTMIEHRAPEDDLRTSYDRTKAAPITRLNAITLVAGEYQAHDFYMNVGPTYADPVARMLYAEIASIEEQHVTQYESLLDPDETWLEKWLLHECMEVYNYWCCLQSEQNPKVKAIWDRFLAYELGQMHYVRDLFEKIEGRDAAQVLPQTLPEPIRYESHRKFVRETLRAEADLRASGARFIRATEERPDMPSPRCRNQLNQEGVASEIVAAAYRFVPGTELHDRAATGFVVGSVH